MIQECREAGCPESGQRAGEKRLATAAGRAWPGRAPVDQAQHLALQVVRVRPGQSISGEMRQQSGHAVSHRLEFIAKGHGIGRVHEFHVPRPSRGQDRHAVAHGLAQGQTPGLAAVRGDVGQGPAVQGGHAAVGQFAVQDDQPGHVQGNGPAVLLDHEADVLGHGTHPGEDAQQGLQVLARVGRVDDGEKIAARPQLSGRPAEVFRGRFHGIDHMGQDPHPGMPLGQGPRRKGRGSPDLVHQSQPLPVDGRQGLPLPYGIPRDRHAPQSGMPSEEPRPEDRILVQHGHVRRLGHVDRLEPGRPQATAVGLAGPAVADVPRKMPPDARHDAPSRLRGQGKNMGVTRW